MIRHASLYRDRAEKDDTRLVGALQVTEAALNGLDGTDQVYLKVLSELFLPQAVDRFQANAARAVNQP